MRILFRVDGDTAIGMGHVSRCLTLAQELEGDILFATKENTPGFDKVKGYFDVLPCEDKRQLPALIERVRPDGVIVDLLNNSDDYLSEVKLPVVSLFDLSGQNPVSSGIVINHNILQEPEHGPLCYLGPDYVLLNKTLLQKKVVKEQCSSILVNSGGSDPYGLTLKILEALSPLDDIINVVVGAACPDYDELRRLSLKRNFNLYHDVTNDGMVEIIKKSDIAVTAGGLTMYECAAAGTPSIVICHHERHNEVAEVFVRRGAVINLGIGQAIEQEKILDAVKRLMADVSLRQRLSERAQSIVDGKGVQRVSQIVRGIA